MPQWDYLPSGPRSYCEIVLPRSQWRRALWWGKQRIRSAMVPRGDGRDFAGWTARWLGQGSLGDYPIGTTGRVLSRQRQRRYVQHEIDLGDNGRHVDTLPSPRWELISPNGRVVRLRPWSWEGLKYRILAW